MKLVVKLISGFITGLFLGFILAYPTDFVLDKFLPISEKWFPELAGLVFIFIVVPLLYGFIGAIFVSTLDIKTPAFNIARKFLAVILVVIAVYGFIGLGLFENIAPAVPWLSADTVPLTKAKLNSAQQDMDFKILVPSHLPQGITKDFGKGAYNINIEKENKKCNSINFNYKFYDELVFVTESRPGIAYSHCKNYLIVASEKIDELITNYKNGNKNISMQKTEKGEVLIKRDEEQQTSGRLREIFLIRDDVIINFLYSGSDKCDPSCENTILELVNSMSPLQN